MPGSAVASRAHDLLMLTRPQLGQGLTKAQQAKFFLCSSAPAMVQPQEFGRFLDYVTDVSVLFKEATVIPMSTNELNIRFLDVSGGVLRQSICGAGCVESVNISNTNKCLRTMTLDAKFFLCDDDLEDNVTGAQFENRVIDMLSKQVANELEIIALMGNTNGIYTSPEVDNTVIALRDGWYRQLQHGHIIDAGSIPGEIGDRELSLRKLTCLLRGIPVKYRQNMGAFRIFIGSDMWFEWAELNQPRQTVLGDNSICSNPCTTYLTVPFVPVPLLPTNLTQCGCGSVPGGSGTFMFATDPANMVLGIEKNITFERWRDCDYRTWFKWKIRFDELILNEDATSLMDCMTLSSCGTGACTPAELSNRCWTCLDVGSCGEPV